MPKPIAVIAADLHVDELIWRDRPQIHSDALWGLTQCVDLAGELSVPLILLGDVVEALSATPNTKTIRHISHQVYRMVDRGLPLYSIAGNHDMETPGWLYACGAQMDNLDMETLKVGPFNCFFFGYRPPHMLSAVIDAIPDDTDIVFAHQHWKELGGGENAQGKISEFKAGKMLMTGDLHEFKDLEVHRKDGGSIRVVSPGATCIRKVNEQSVHYAIVLMDDMSIKRHKLRSRIVLRTTIDSEHQLASFCSQLPAAIKKAEQKAKHLPFELRTPLLVVRDSSWIAGAKDRLEHVVGPSAHLLYYRSARGIDKELTFEANPQQATAMDLLPVMLTHEVDKEDPVHDLLLGAITSENYRDTIRDFRARIVN